MNNVPFEIEYNFMPSKDNAVRLQKAYCLILGIIEVQEEEKETGGQND